MKIKVFMYQSKEFLEKKSTATLKRYLGVFLKKTTFVRCKALGNRKVFLAKLPHAILTRRDVGERLRSFWVGLDILRHSLYIKHRFCRGKDEYEIEGFSAENKRIYVHLREEIIQKDRKLFFISTYCKK